MLKVADLENEGIFPTMFTGQMHQTKTKNKKRLRQRSLHLGFCFSFAAAVCDSNIGRKQEGKASCIHSITASRFGESSHNGRFAPTT